MGAVQNIVAGWAINWLVGELAGANIDWSGLKAKFKAAVESIPHIPKFVDAELELLANQILDAAESMIKDKDDVTKMLTALAQSNPAAAKDAVKALIVPQLPAEIAAVVKAA